MQMEKKASASKMDEENDERRKELGLLRNQIQKEREELRGQQESEKKLGPNCPFHLLENFAFECRSAYVVLPFRMNGILAGFLSRFFGFQGVPKTPVEWSFQTLEF